MGERPSRQTRLCLRAAVLTGTGPEPPGERPDVRLVMINGVARYGVKELMEALAPDDQTVRVGGETRRLYLQQETTDPDVTQVP